MLKCSNNKDIPAMHIKICHTILNPNRDCAWAGLEYGLGRVHFSISVFYLSKFASFNTDRSQ
jgi:hypothetical protein